MNERYTADFHDKVTWEEKTYHFAFRDCPFTMLDGPEQVPFGGADISNLTTEGFDMVVTDLQLFVERAVVYTMAANDGISVQIEF